MFQYKVSFAQNLQNFTATGLEDNKNSSKFRDPPTEKGEANLESMETNSLKTVHLNSLSLQRLFLQLSQH